MKAFTIHISVIALCVSGLFADYAPNWDSLDTRPLPVWYDEAKFGIFLHWGVYSVPSFGSEWFWNSWEGGTEEYVGFMNENYPKSFTYQEFAKDFTAEFFNATEWAELFASSGAKYIVLTSKHHEGFALWPSKYAYSWNAKDIGPKRDLIDELAAAVRRQNLTFGLYHSLFEWFNPLFLSDQNSSFVKREFAVNKVLPEMRELIELYQPSVIWSDGQSSAPDVYWNSTGFLAWLYNESPVKDHVVVNDRWGKGVSCKHGDFYTCSDRYNPGVLQPHKWENAMTIDKHSWGFRRNAKLEDYLSVLQLLTELASTVSCGGNILMNVGPTKDGIIAPIFQQRLKDIGKWLSINGEAIYSSKPWTAQNDTLTPDVWYTSKNDSVYAIVLFWPEKNTLRLASALDIFKSSDASVTLLGNENDGELKWSLDSTAVVITFPDKAIVKSEWAYVIQIEPAKSILSL